MTSNKPVKLVKWFKNVITDENRIGCEESSYAKVYTNGGKKILIIFPTPPDQCDLKRATLHMSDESLGVEDLEFFTYYFGTYRESDDQLSLGYLATDDIDSWMEQNCPKFVESEELTDAIEEVNSAITLDGPFNDPYSL
jgi:hypothetical protein